MSTDVSSPINKATLCDPAPIERMLNNFHFSKTTALLIPACYGHYWILQDLFLLKSALTCAKPLVYFTISGDVIHSIFKEDFLQPKTMKDILDKQQCPQPPHCVRASRFQTSEWFFNGFLKIHSKLPD